MDANGNHNVNTNSSSSAAAAKAPVMPSCIPEFSAHFVDELRGVWPREEGGPISQDDIRGLTNSVVIQRFPGRDKANGVNASSMEKMGKEVPSSSDVVMMSASDGEQEQQQPHKVKLDESRDRIGIYKLNTSG